MFMSHIKSRHAIINLSENAGDVKSRRKMQVKERKKGPSIDKFPAQIVCHNERVGVNKCFLRTTFRLRFATAQLFFLHCIEKIKYSEAVNEALWLSLSRRS